MQLSRVWAMPNSKTFTIKPIRALIEKYISDESVDMFANSNKLAKYTNDLDPEYDTDEHMDALEYLKSFPESKFDTVLFDPPYSPRQVSECYRALDMTVNMQTTQSSFWGNLKKEISRTTKQGGICITCGWNSGGIGKSNGFELIEVLNVPHGGWHNDTIVTVERKL